MGVKDATCRVYQFGSDHGLYSMTDDGESQAIASIELPDSTFEDVIFTG